MDEVATDGGLVVGPDQQIADAGAAILQAGGNAVDAAVAGAFASSVVEPPMSGVGGAATMTVALRDPERVAVLEGHVVTPGAASPEHFPLSDAPAPQGSGPGPWSVGFYDWVPVEEQVNIIGARAACVPGAVACLCAAHERYGRLPLADVLRPAIGLAADGFGLNWYMASLFAADFPVLMQDPGCREVYLPSGIPPRGPGGRPPDRIVQPALARTLEAIAAGGPDAFYRGPIAASVVEAVGSAGGLLSMADLREYRPSVFEPPPPAAYGPFEVAGSPVSGFPTVLEALLLYEAASSGAEDEAVAWARALHLAFADRFRYMTGDPAVRVPWAGLRSRDYARARLAAHVAGKPEPDPHEYSGEPPGPATEPGNPGPVGHTSQVACVDRDGNVASVTTTLQGGFGCRFMDPATGVLLNNGMSYFDPRPGVRNSIAPGVTALSAMTPLVLIDPARGPVAALGASGGRRIISGVAQIVAALGAGGVSLQEAIEAPRIHAESETVLLDERWPAEARAALEGAGYQVVPATEEPTTPFFARPGGVTMDPDGTRRSGLDPRKPGGAAVA